MHPELDKYIPHYLSHRPILEKVFDPANVEIQSEYRPRPLSYLVDDLDVAFIGWSTRIGHPHLLSASSYVLWFIDAALLWFFFRRFFHLDRLTSGLLIALLAEDPVLLSTTYYFRSAKAGATCCLLASFFCLATCYKCTVERQSRRHRVVAAALGAFLLFSGSLFDEQPAAFAVAAIVMLCIVWYAKWGTPVAEACRYCLVAIVAGLSAFIIYDLVIHPKLLEIITGRTWSNSYQTGLLSLLLSQSIMRALACIGVLGDVFGFLAGNMSSELALALVFATMCIYSVGLKSQRETTGKSQIQRWLSDPMLQIFIGFVLVWGITFAMVARHPPLLWSEVRRSSYYLPITVVFLLVLAGALARLVDRGSIARGMLHLVLLIFLISNVISLRRIADQRSLGHLAYRYQMTPLLFDGLRNKNGITPQMLADPYTGNLAKQVLESPTYHALRSLRNWDK